ncbi:MAG: hypothetical protein KGJ23_15930 [Euryarchaeota archaeon]|nr:hypothetical protein [Euryarchaeota archaeon]MDE1838088.1 hypothetical protein [Euryarchaeota archaeon]MDE1881910.1 hypothetical protein [Euryarchaeota archaeon]MDE2046548.1 hypothetical protein [Thermoplasmata archaeon]
MSPRPALTPSQVRLARDARRKGVSAAGLSRRFGVDRSAIQRALRGLPPYAGIRDPPPLPPGWGRLEADRRLTNAQVGLLRAAAREGETISSLAERFRVARLTVRKAVYGGRPYDGLRDSPPLPVPAWNQRERVLTPRLVALARRLRLDGVGPRDIASRLGVSAGTVNNALRGRHAYTRVGGLRPVRREEEPPRAVLSVAEVRDLRRLRGEKGLSTNELRARFHVKRRAVVSALLGRPPYEGVADPPPFPAEELERGALTRTQVRELRTLRKGGATLSSLERRFGVSRTVVLRATFGRPPYGRVRSPRPLAEPTGKPRLAPVEVSRLRDLRLAGWEVRRLARSFKTDRRTVASALYGFPPYGGVDAPRRSRLPLRAPRPSVTSRCRRSVAATGAASGRPTSPRGSGFPP